MFVAVLPQTRVTRPTRRRRQTIFSSPQVKLKIVGNRGRYLPMTDTDNRSEGVSRPMQQRHLRTLACFILVPSAYAFSNFARNFGRNKARGTRIRKSSLRRLCRATSTSADPSAPAAATPTSTYASSKSWRLTERYLLFLSVGLGT